MCFTCFARLEVTDSTRRASGRYSCGATSIPPWLRLRASSPSTDYFRRMSEIRHEPFVRTSVVMSWTEPWAEVYVTSTVAWDFDTWRMEEWAARGILRNPSSAANRMGGVAAAREALKYPLADVIARSRMARLKRSIISRTPAFPSGILICTEVGPTVGSAEFEMEERQPPSAVTRSSNAHGR